MNAKELIRRYESDHGCDATPYPHIGLGRQKSIRLYGFIKPLKNGEAVFEVWIAGNSRRKGRKLMMKCVYRMRTDSETYSIRDTFEYMSWSNMVHPHLVYDFHENGGPTADYARVQRIQGQEQNKWYRVKVIRAEENGFCERLLPKPDVILNGWDDTKYKYWAYDPACGLCVADYIALYRITPKVELLSKAGLFRLLTPDLCGFLERNPRFGKFLACHIEEAKNWSPYTAKRMYAKTDPVCAEQVRRDRREAEERRMIRAIEAERRRARKERNEYKRKYDAAIRDLYNRLKDVCTEFGAYEVIVPKTSADMLDEGAAMHNCIGKHYASRQGKDDICIFLHKGGKPCVDIRISLKTLKLVECRGVCNKDADKMAWEVARQVAEAVRLRLAA